MKYDGITFTVDGVCVSLLCQSRLTPPESIITDGKSSHVYTISNYLKSINEKTMIARYSEQPTRAVAAVRTKHGSALNRPHGAAPL